MSALLAPGLLPIARFSVAALVVMSIIHLPLPAAAESPFDYGYTGGDNKIRQPDSRDHWHCKEHFPHHHDWLDQAMDQIDRQTVITRGDSRTCRKHTDVVWIVTELWGIGKGQGAGEAICVTHIAWGICDQYWILLDQPLLYVTAQAQPRPHRIAWYRNNVHLVMRHELGRTAGLHHGPDGQLNTRYGPMVSAPIYANHPRTLEFLAYAPFQVRLINRHL